MGKEKLLENVIKACEEEYKDKISIFNQLDAKAQQVAAFSSVLLGFLLSFCKKDYIEFLSSISLWCIIICIVSIILFLLSISLSIFSMRIIKTLGLPTFSDIRREYNDLINLKNKDYNDEYYLVFLKLKIDLFDKTFDDLFKADEKKAKFIFTSQILCGIGLIFLGLLAIIILQKHLTLCTC